MRLGSVGYQYGIKQTASKSRSYKWAGQRKGGRRKKEMQRRDSFQEAQQVSGQERNNIQISWLLNCYFIYFHRLLALAWLSSILGKNQDCIMGWRHTSSTALCSLMQTLGQITSSLRALLVEGKFGWSSCEREGLGKPACFIGKYRAQEWLEGSD